MWDDRLESGHLNRATLLRMPRKQVEALVLVHRAIRDAISVALAAGVEADEIVLLLTSTLPGLCDRRSARAHVMAAFDSVNRDSDRAMPFRTGPFDRRDPESL